jgi:hypothetical protein
MVPAKKPVNVSIPVKLLDAARAEDINLSAMLVCSNREIEHLHTGSRCDVRARLHARDASVLDDEIAIRDGWR